MKNKTTKNTNKVDNTNKKLISKDISKKNTTSKPRKTRFC